MKSYKRPEAELINIQLSAFCGSVNISSYEIEAPSLGGLVGGATEGFQQSSGVDDLYLKD